MPTSYKQRTSPTTTYKQRKTVNTTYKQRGNILSNEYFLQDNNGNFITDNWGNYIIVGGAFYNKDTNYNLRNPI